MPRVKIDYIVSFSSEDPENQASNLLAWEVNKKKWLCSKGEPSCSVVLQLAQAVQICTVQVGSYHSALVEVLVGRSESPNEPFQVLVPRSVFLSPAESRRAAADRVRSFAAAALAAARLQRWDRVRLVCSQPYDKHCKYGLSFVHIYSPETTALPPAPAPAPATATFSSDEEEVFRPGELFAQHRQSASAAAPAASDTGAQIRQATSQALKNIPDSSIKLTKTALTKTDRRRNSRAGDDSVADRQRAGLLYSADDERPRRRVDRAIDAHRDRQPGDAHGQSTDSTQKQDDRNNKTLKLNRDRPSDGEKRRDAASERDGEGPSGARDSPSYRKKDSGSSGAARKGDQRGKRSHSDRGDDEGEALRAGPRSSAPHTLLRDVVFVLSGYENPRRAALRSAALALGAACERDWSPRCTHLICAFANTPKLKQVRAAAGGGGAPAVRGEWLEETARRRRRLPWQWFATEPARRRTPPPSLSGDDTDEAECDTDDEIERVREKMKKRRSPPPASPPPPTSPPPHSPPPASPPRTPPPASLSATSTNSEVTFVRDDRIQGTVTVEDSDGSRTEEDSDADPRADVAPAASLPDLLRGRTFLLRGEDAARRARYVRAHGGLVLDEALNAEGGVDYVLCDDDDAGAPAPRGALRLRAAWLWRCLAARRLLDVHEYRLE